MGKKTSQFKAEIAEMLDLVVNSLYSKKRGGTSAFMWESDMKGGYTISDAEREDFGTSVMIHLKDHQVEYLDLWRDYVKKGLTTTQESPDWTDASGKGHESRSDCHAWGAHPIWFMQTGLAGIRSAAPFFEKVLVAPCPGTLTELKAKHPHPQGFIEVDLTFKGGKASGTVKTPVAGTFVFGDQRIGLVPGENAIR